MSIYKFTISNTLGLSQEEVFERAKSIAREEANNSDVKFISVVDNIWTFQVTKKEETRGVKFDGGKPEFCHTPVEFNIGVAKAFTYGAKKYSPDNFREGMSARRLLNAMERHMLLEKAGVEKDTESGLPHWAHAAASLAMYVFVIKHRKHLDDRYKYTEQELNTILIDMYGYSNEKI